MGGSRDANVGDGMRRGRMLTAMRGEASPAAEERGPQTRMDAGIADVPDAAVLAAAVVTEGSDGPLGEGDGQSGYVTEVPVVADSVDLIGPGEMMYLEWMAAGSRGRRGSSELRGGGGRSRRGRTVRSGCRRAACAACGRPWNTVP